MNYVSLAPAIFGIFSHCMRYGTNKSVCDCRNKKICGNCSKTIFLALNTLCGWTSFIINERWLGWCNPEEQTVLELYMLTWKLLLLSGRITKLKKKKETTVINTHNICQFSRVKTRKEWLWFLHTTKTEFV